ncbi:hypothetical protein E2562_037144 [Oryza meyeriana var. granulata]|uniref:Uncharacterized protein n=1 Tax=Oryza meyeriana var. granulata TaxID=110450 RepID=A0A6G1CXY8_9ORYZ|nr:hypothetical protein E2562_037144 [Oryza meyeriana var. granulata]
MPTSRGRDKGTMEVSASSPAAAEDAMARTTAGEARRRLRGPPWRWQLQRQATARQRGEQGDGVTQGREQPGRAGDGGRREQQRGGDGAQARQRSAGRFGGKAGEGVGKVDGDHGSRGYTRAREEEGAGMAASWGVWHAHGEGPRK